MGTRVLSGRVFDAHDTDPRARIVIDETLAAKVWPGQPAVGKRLQLVPAGSPGDLYAEVIGVVEHMRILDLTQAGTAADLDAGTAASRDVLHRRPH